jgi:ABC-type branched-subunit amino acid transport system substrate-binding protein
MRGFSVMVNPARAKLVRLILCSLLAAALLAACDDTDNGPTSGGSPQPTPTATDSRVIGLVGTLSGPNAWRGEDAFEGADVSVGDLNRKLEADEVPFELVSLDDEGDPARALELVGRLAESPRTVGIVFAGPPGGLPGAEGVLAAAGIPAILCYGDLYGARQLSAHTFQMSPSYLWQGRTLARYIAADRGYRTVGLLAEDSSDGRTAATALRQELGSSGLSLSRTVIYDPTSQGFRGDLKELREAQVEALVVHGGPSVVATILADLRSMGIRYTGTDDARVASAPRRQRRRRSDSRYWRPQVMALDLAISDETDQSIPVGMVASDTYARGAHYLPIPSFKRFKASFHAWWDALPTGWELRSYDSVKAIGWAARHASQGDDLAETLETLDGKRFGGLPMRFGPDDHTAVDEATVGLWTLPPIPPDAPDSPQLEWVPLARGFSINGQRTTVLPDDWRYLFRNPPPRSAPPPRISNMKFGVTSSRRDPIR